MHSREVGKGWGKVLLRKEARVADKIIKVVSLIIRKMQIKSMEHCHFSPVSNFSEIFEPELFLH